jgi:hypothetical protein
MALSNKRKLQLIEARGKAAQAKKRLRLEEDGAHSRLEESAHSGLGDSSHSGLEDSAHSGPEDCAHSGLEDCAHSGLEDSAHSELEDFSDDSSISDSDTVDEGSEGNITDSDDDTPADAADESAPIPESHITLHWNDEAGKDIRGTRGTGSKSTEKRARRHQRELEKAASQSYSIVGLFERQRSLGLSMEAQDGTRAVPLQDIERGTPKASLTACQTKENARHDALQDLKRFLSLKGEQKRKYGKLLTPGKDFHRRHLMVASFLMLQQRKHEFQDRSRRALSAIVAKSFGRGAHTGLKIVRWEKSWVEERTIPESKAGKHRQGISWMNDEEVLLAVQQFVKTQGEGQFEKVFTPLT